MGVIQQGINQGLGLAALGVSQVPSVKAKLETNKEIAASEMAAEKAHQSLNAADDAFENALNSVDWDDPKAALNPTVAKDLKEQQLIAQEYAVGKYKNAYEINPTKENLENYQFEKKQLEQLQKASNQKAQEVKEAKITQRRNFKSYLAQMPYSVGGHEGLIGDLPEKTQKLFAKQYNARDRKSIMDKMDKERKDKERKEKK